MFARNSAILLTFLGFWASSAYAQDPVATPAAATASAAKPPCADCADEHGKPHGECDDCDEDGDECDDCDGAGDDRDRKGDCPDCKGKDKADCPECPFMAKKGGPWRRGGMPPRLHGPSIRPIVLLQTQYAGFTGAANKLVNGDRAQTPGFTMRRAVVGLEGKYGQRVDFAVSADLAAPQMLTNAYLQMDMWRGGEVIFGAQKLPFYRSAMLSSGDQALAERPKAMEAMAPLYQTGMTLRGHYPKIAGLAWFLGAYNSWERDRNFFAGVQQNAGIGASTRFDGLAFVARLQAEPFGELGPSVADVTHGKFKLGVGVSAYLNDSGATRATAHAADLLMKFKGWHVLVEAMQDTAAPRDLPTTTTLIPAEITRKAMIAELGYSMWRFNVAARGEIIDPDTNVKDNRDEMIGSFALGYSLPRNAVRAQLQYDHRQESQGPALANDTLFLQFQFKL